MSAPAEESWPLQAADTTTRGVRRCFRAAYRGVIEFYRSDNLTFAASIGYYSLLSLFPFLLLLLSLLSQLHVGAADVTILNLILSALPSRLDFVTLQVRKFEQTPLQLNFFGTVVLFWAAMGVFGAVTSAVNHAWGVEKPPSFLKHKLTAFIMLLAAGLLLIVALLLVSAVQVVQANWFAGILARFPALALLRSFVVSNAVTGMFIFVVGLVYYFIPATTVRVGDVWFGAVLAGVLWRIVFAVFSWYVRDVQRFSVHGSIAAVVVFLIWVYTSAVIFLYGVEVSAAYARLRRVD